MSNKLDGNEEPVIAVESTSITNIYYDCLERIFEFLELEDLLNVAQTCKRLQIAAAANFNDWWGGTLFMLDSIYDNNDFEGFHFVDYEGEVDEDEYYDATYIRVVGMKFCLPFLRCFGPKISRLCIYYMTSTTCNFIDNYINQYCADTLIVISYEGREEDFTDELFLKPFKKVETLEIFDSKFEQLQNFVDWFPNLRNLEIEGCLIRCCHEVSVYFPLLEHLCIYFCGDMVGDDVKAIENLLHAHKQLQSVRFIFKNRILLSMSKLLELISSNQLIYELIIEADKGVVVNVSGSDLLQFASERQMMCALDLKPCLLDVDNAVAFIRLLNQLDFIKFRVKNRAEYDRLLNKLDSNWKHKFYLDKNNTDHHIITLTQ